MLRRLRPRLVIPGIGVALSLCACSLDTAGLSPDVGRLPVNSDTGLTGGSGGVGSGSGGATGGNGGGVGGATGGNVGSGGNAGSGGSAGDATGGTAGAGEDASVANPDVDDADAAGGGGGTDVAPGGTGGVVVIDAAPPQEMRIISAVGCADGTREGFLSLNRYPGIAACSGGWTEPGLNTPAAATPLCDHRGGNSGPYPGGGTCSAIDLCAVGWYVCDSGEDVLRHSPDCDDAVEPANGSPIFYATRQTSSTASCNGSGTSNIVGCGNIGAQIFNGCGALNARMDSEACARYRPWQCGDPDEEISIELRVVTKPGSTRGGVLCCRK